MLCDSKSQLKAEFRKKLNKYLASKASNEETSKKENLLQNFSDKGIIERICESRQRVEQVSGMKNQGQDILKPVALRPKRTPLEKSSYRLSSCLNSESSIGKRDSMFIDQRSSFREQRGAKSKSICAENEWQPSRERPCLNLMKNFVKQSDEDLCTRTIQLAEKNSKFKNKNGLDDKFIQQFKIDLNQIENDTN
ncbi:hypothetical protein BpHYR1_000821 [Brachionus plicatilis]|uniref:Uncharacterized protein n=1 Tax=Brachionus plicatilis TaxID=10195 RepID=A0A3M7P436_BRAPC|nr:hypothetical protein BpHYR1_000821 [Brachionus plicatilis]